MPAVITFCPLCNSALAFDRRVGDQVFEFGVSGLLRNSDLIMYDRTTETLWQQFTGDGIIGELTGERLTFLPTSIVSFTDFREAFPDGQILSRDTGLRGNYGSNPYAGYDTYDHALSAGGNLALFQGDNVKAKMEPKLVSPLVVYLASDLSNELTGKTFFVGQGRIAEMRVVTHTGVTKSQEGGLWTPAEIAEKMKAGEILLAG